MKERKGCYKREIRAVSGWFFALLTLLAACDPQRSADDAIPNADADRGATLIIRSGCGACHVVPGIRGAGGMVGPPLTDFARRTLVAGRISNSPDNLVRWLVDPPSVDPETAMPRVGLSEAEARDVAAYLYTLR